MAVQRSAICLLTLIIIFILQVPPGWKLTPKDLLVHHPELDADPDADEYECTAGILTYRGFGGFVPIMHHHDDVGDETIDLFVHDGTYYLYGRDFQGIRKILPPATLEEIVDAFTNITSYPRLESMGKDTKRGIRCMLQLKESGIETDIVPEY